VPELATKKVKTLGAALRGAAKGERDPMVRRWLLTLASALESKSESRRVG
jgi:hypothetical protein